MTEFTAVLLVWVSTLFGGEGPEGRPLKATITYPSERLCRSMLRQFVAYTVKHIVVQDCKPVEAALDREELLP